VLGLAWKCNVREHRPLRREQPFSSDRRMASVVVDEPSGPRSYVRGAPEAVMARSVAVQRDGGAFPLGDEDRKAVLAAAATWAGGALRVIALALRDGHAAVDDPERGLTFLGLVGIIDPPRPEVRAAIAEARSAGIQTMMITGDHPATARAIAAEIGLWSEGDLILTGSELDGMAQAALVERVERLRVVARATAENKLRIVDALKQRGLVCAMTGDGVNDAPAVKSASIGVAMGRAGTDVTKEAADLVLADDNYATIIAAVEEGRAIYANIRKFVFFLLSSNAGIVLVVLAASLLGWHSPLAPIQILWINLITNGLPALALGVDTPDPDEMRAPPRPPGGSILSTREYVEIVVIGVIMAVTALAAFYVGLAEAGGASQDVALPIDQLDRARTICFGILAIGPLFHAFNCRSKTKSLFRLGVFSNRPLWYAVLVGLLLEIATIYVPPLRPIFRTVPLDGEAIAWIGAMSIAPFVIGELVKLVGMVRPARS
jgi:Ca2+-transporting ATPase